MNASKLTRFVRLLALSLIAPALANAHPGHDGHELTWDFQSGFNHPFSGWDHLLAMIAVGLWVSQLSGRPRFLVPACFVGIMALAAEVGRAGISFAGLDAVLAASVLVLGLLVAKSANLPLAGRLVMVGGFAIFHGLAHGAESTGVTNTAGFGLGFLAATGLLIAAGVSLGVLFAKHSPALVRISGWFLALAGLGLLVSS